MKPVAGYEDQYLVSPSGGIYSIVWYGRWLKQQMHRGYKIVTFKDGKTHRVHRIVATAYIENPEGKLFVNHKNGIKSDNAVNNLEWCTHSENMKHAYQIGVITMPRRQRKQ